MTENWADLGVTDEVIGGRLNEKIYLSRILVCFHQYCHYTEVFDSPGEGMYL